MKDFFYMSEQIHSVWEDTQERGKGPQGRGKGKGPHGKPQGRTRRNVVQVRGSHGIKSVETYDREGHQLTRKEKKLTKQEMDCIKRNEFIPGLFKDCIKPLNHGNRKLNKTRKNK
jgi:hypothetical protein